MSEEVAKQGDPKPQESVEEEEQCTEEEEIDHTPKFDPEIGDVVISPVPPAKKLRRVEVEICPICGFPTCYCKFGQSKHEQYEERLKKRAEKQAAAGDKPAKIPVDTSFEVPDTVGIDEAVSLKEQEEHKKAKPPQKILIVTKQRNKKKATTTISGLQRRGVDVKELAKLVSKKMCAAAAMKEKAAEEVIVFQGDANQQLIDLIKRACGVTDKDIQVSKKKEAPKPAVV